MNDEWQTENDFEASKLWPNQSTMLAFAWRDWGKPQKASVRIATVSANIWTKHLPTTDLQHYQYANLLSQELWKV
jgi:hypothetical protein